MKREITSEGIEKTWALNHLAYFLLFTRELARRLAGTGVTVNAVHPGFVPAAFTRGTDFASQMFLLVTRPFAKTLTEGAATSLYVATAPQLEGVSDKYFADSRETPPSLAAQDDDLARRLWAISETQLIASNRA